MASRVVVTGGSGFIGRALTEALAAQGCEVGVVDNKPYKGGSSGSSEMLCADIASTETHDWIIAYRPRVVFHLAAQIDVRQSVADPFEDARVNVMGSVNIGRAAALGGADTLVFSSSGGAIYGDSALVPTPETTECRPLSPYGASKRAAEVLLETIGRSGRVRVVVLRYANVYGPGQGASGEGGVVSSFARALISGRSVTINGDGKQTRDFVHVDDIVSANLAAWGRRVEGCFNVGTGIETSVNELFSHLARITRYQRKPEYGPPKPGEARRSCLAVGGARASLGWTAQIDLERGLRATIASL